MDIEVSFFTFDWKLLVTGKVKKKRKFKEKIRRRIERREDIFLKIFRSSTATRIPRGTSHVFREERKEAWQRIFLYRRIVVIASATVEQISAPLDTTDYVAHS